MSTFTMPLKRVIEISGGTTEIVNGVSKLTNGDIGLSHYPLFDEAYRDHLDGIIIDHFWNREIGVESISMFQFFMRRKMNEIMPFYNKLYNSEKIAFDPLSTVNLSTINNATSNQASDSTSNSVTESTNSSDSRSVSSNMPQTMLSGSADYATAASDVKGDSDVQASGTESAATTVDNTQASDSTTTGYQGSASALLAAYRDTLLNIDMMIVRDLEELFMLVWDTGDSYANSEGTYF